MSVDTSLGAAAGHGALERAGGRLYKSSDRTARGRQIAWLNTATVAAVPLLALVICIAATRTDILVPQSIRPLGTVGMGGLFNVVGFHLTTGELLPTVVALLVAYFFAVRCSERVSPRTVIAAVVAINVIAVLAPPIFSTDMFSYQAYARMFAIYHDNPYTHGPYAINLDPIYPFIGAQWYQTPSVYGPLFTLVSAPLAWVSILASELTYKIVGGLCMAATLRLVWKASLVRGVNPIRGVALLGLNPLVTICCVGGGHNDSLMVWLMMLGVYSAITQRERSAGALMLASSAIKLTGGVVLPFALLANAGADVAGRRKRLLVGIAAAGALIATASFIFFGFGAFRLFSTLRSVQAEGAWQSVPGLFFAVSRLHSSGVIRDALNVVMFGILIALMWRVWKGRLEWIDGAAWASVALLATAWSMLPWYVTFLIPLVAISRDPRLWRAAMVMSAAAGAIMVAECVTSISFLGI